MNPFHLDVPGGAAGAAAELPDALLAAGLLFVASAVPFAVGLALAGRWRGAPATVAGVAAGAVLFLLIDLVRQSAIGVGLLRPLTTLALVAAFSAGMLLPAWLPRRLGRAPGGAAWPSFAWALGIGAHGAGEGFVVGTEAHTALFALPLFGAASFVLHKGIEGATVRPLADAAASRRGLVAMTLAAASPAAAGALVGALLGPSLLGPLLFAVGAGAAAWAVLALAQRGHGAPRFFAAALAGALAVWGAGLLHEI